MNARPNLARSDRRISAKEEVMGWVFLALFSPSVFVALGVVMALSVVNRLDGWAMRRRFPRAKSVTDRQLLTEYQIEDVYP